MSDMRSAEKSLGRPREFDRDVVLAAAVELFWSRGYRATTTRDLERALGLRPSSLYNTFGSKRGLLDAALDRYEEMTDRELLAPLEGSGSGLEAIDAFFAALGSWVTNGDRGGCMLVNLMGEDGGATAELSVRCRGYRYRVRGALLASLEQAAESGEISRAGLGAKADLLLGLVLGLNVAARGRAARGEVESLLAAVRGLVGSWRSAS